MRSFLAEYISGAPDLLACYAAPLASLFSEEPRRAPWNAELVTALRDYQGHIGGTATFTGDEAVVITGQQPAIFTGPLYTIYKAVTVVGLAKLVTERSGVPCVPIFWVGSEDHDFEEARFAHILTKSHESYTLRYTPVQDVEGFSMDRVPLEPSLHGFIDDAAAQTSGSEFREPVAAFLHESLDASSSLSEWTARILARLFQDTPLVFFVPNLPAARAAAVPVLEHEINHPLESTRLLNEAGRRLESLGFPPQVLKGDRECNFFLQVGERRRKVLYEKGQFRLPEEESGYTPEELLALLHESPERFSPNVALRCIAQQAMFPVGAYVAGPGELAYWAQLKPLFKHFGQPMPVVYPRAQCALTTIKLNKLRAKLGLSLDDLTNHHDSLLEQALRNTATSAAYTFAQDRRKEIEAAVAGLAEGLGDLDKTAASMAESLGGELGSKLDRLERAILQGDQAKKDATEKQLARLCNSFAPGKKLQERHYTVFSYLFEHGWELIPRLLREIDPERFEMQEIEL